MKILRTEHSRPKLKKNPDQTVKKSKPDEFRKILARTLKELSEGDEELRVLIPRHGQFWDNGYEDVG